MVSHTSEPVPTRLRGLDPERVLGLLDDDLAETLPRIPGWHISGVAGQGGSGIVWRAEREVDGAIAAIKIAPPNEPDTVERIEREAGFLRDLRHPNIVGLLETGPLLEGADEGGLYMAMEYIDGPSLQHEIPEHGLPPQQAYQWFREIATAVAYAHDCGILHRDLKPANVLLAPDDRIKVADFGLARPVHRRVHMLSLTRAGLVAGTAEYLPPEAYRRDYKPAQSADIFALGVMLHEMLTGTPPRGAWQPASTRRGVDVRIDGLIRRAMEPDPAKRWPDAKAMLAGLDQILASSPRYSGTPLVTLPIRVADCLWTILGLLVFLASLSSLLALRQRRFSLPLNLVADHSKMVGGFHALFFLLGACIPLALWQLIRLRRFRHIPMREALPSPFGLNLGHGVAAAWLVAICQLLCFLLPLSHMLTIYTNSSHIWLKPDDPPWVHGLAFTEMSGNEIVNPWKFQSFDKWFWLHESHGPPGHPLVRYVDKTGFIPGFVPAIMTTGAVLMAAALIVTLLTAGRGWWLRERKLHVIASLALLATVGTGIGKAHQNELRQVIRHGPPGYSSTFIREERMEITPLYQALPRLASRHHAVDWAMRLEHAFDAVGTGEMQLADALAGLFESTLLLRQGNAPPALISLEASPVPVVFRKLSDGRLGAIPGQARVLGPQPGGRSRITVPLRDPRNGGHRELTADLIFRDQSWRAVGLAF